MSTRIDGPALRPKGGYMPLIPKNCALLLAATLIFGAAATAQQPKNQKSPDLSKNTASLKKPDAGRPATNAKKQSADTSRTASEHASTRDPHKVQTADKQSQQDTPGDKQ